MGTPTHGTIGSYILKGSLLLYDALFRSIWPAFNEHPKRGRNHGRGDRPGVGVLGTYDGNDAPVAPLSGFIFDTRKEVAAFHAKARELGAPGERVTMMYFANFRDLGGNTLCDFSVG
jgi:hypothetical protein